MAELTPRITGTETEWCIVACDTKSQDYELLPPSLTGGLINKHLPVGLARLPKPPATSGYLSNGARMYVDVGQHLEYCTPEDDSLWGTVANEVAAQSIVKSALDSMTPGESLHFKLNNRVVDKNGETWGYHENYFMPLARGLPKGRDLDLFCAHLASRCIFAGAGYQTKTGAFYISQKSSLVLDDVSSATTRLKPLFNTRDEAHTGNIALGKRVHVVSGDPNMSPWASFMKLATTSLVLRLIENGVYPTDRLETCVDMGEVARRYGRDPSLKAAVKNTDGKTLTALNMQEVLIMAADELATRHSLPLEEKVALGAWKQIIEDLRADPTKTVDRLDWTAKMQSLRRQRKKLKLNRNDPRLQGIDWRWDEISDNGTALQLRKRRDWAAGDLDAELCAERIFKAPETTRAHDRGRFIIAAASKDNATVSWDKVACGTSVTLANPAAADDPKVTALIDNLNSLA